MRSVHQHNVSVFGNVMRESTPPCLSREWKASKSSQMENFAVAIAHQTGDVLVKVIVVQFIWARTLCKHGILAGNSKLLYLLIDDLIDKTARKGRIEMLLDGGQLISGEFLVPFLVKFFFENRVLDVAFDCPRRNFAIESIGHQILSRSSLTASLEDHRFKNVRLVAVDVDHEATENDQFAVRPHPTLFDDIFKECGCNFVHFPRQYSLLLICVDNSENLIHV